MRRWQSCLTHCLERRIMNGILSKLPMNLSGIIFHIRQKCENKITCTASEVLRADSVLWTIWI